MPEAKVIRSFPCFFPQLSQLEWHFSALQPEESCLPQHVRDVSQFASVDRHFPYPLLGSDLH